jgi:glycosyltransferase involved in cell wall biosynthesis
MHAGRAPVIGLLTLSRIADDPRVRRQGDALARAGWHVIGIGLPGGRAPAPDWSISDRDGWREARRGSLAGICRRIGLAFGGQLVRLAPGYANRLYWRALPQAGILYAAGRKCRADIWLANDWATLPIAARLAAENGGIYCYDTHELASEEFAEQWKWRIFKRPLVCAVERRLIGGAAVVSTVSAGIAEMLAGRYRLPHQPLVIRNMPSYRKVLPSPAGAVVNVLYHGIVAPNRGLEAAIDSVALWRAEFRLTIRGPGAADYIAALRARAAAAGVGERVSLEPAVPMDELVREAAKSDIGLHALPGHSPNNRLALPNKLFEYIMAGLCLCMIDLPEIGRIVRDYDLGRTFSNVDAGSIAAAVNSLERAEIDRCKANSAHIARDLCWERESERLLAAYGAFVAAPALAGMPG